MKIDDEIRDILIDEFGTEIADRIFAIFAGSSLYFTKSHQRQARNDEIRTQNEAGVSVEILARRYNLSVTHIRRILS